MSGFTPDERPRVAIAADGTMAAIHERSRVTVLEIPSCDAFAELGMDPNALATDVTWVGSPPRLLVVSRFETHSTAHLVDPLGPRTIAEVRLETPMRLVAAVGTNALVTNGQGGSAILIASDKNLTPFQFPSRANPTAAGAAGAQFMVALPGAIEEWDPGTRMPKRRLKLARVANITAVGGSDRVVWMTTQQDPARIDVIPLVNRGQPKVHELPEPIASVASHPRSDLIACIGATSGRMWVIDLDGRAGLRVVGAQGVDRPEAAGIVLGRVAGVLAAQAKRPVAVVALERGDASDAEPSRAKTPSAPPPEKRSSLYGESDDETHRDEAPTSVTLATPLADSSLSTAPAKPPQRPPLPQFGTPVPPTPAPAPPAPAARAGVAKATPALAPPTSLPSSGELRAKALSAFRDRIESPRARTSEPVATLWPDADATWRQHLVGWARQLMKGAAIEVPATPCDAIVTRLELAPQLQPIIAFAYARYLMGEPGISPMEVATLQPDLTLWDEALGRGELVARDAMTFRDGRMRLTDLVLRALDEHLPRTGVLVGTPSIVSLLGPCVIVSSGPIHIIAEACLSSIGGAILAANPDVDPADLVAEARPYGAAPMWRVRTEQLHRVPAEQPFILVADDDETADQLGVPRLT